MSPREHSEVAGQFALFGDDAAPDDIVTAAKSTAVAPIQGKSASTITGRYDRWIEAQHAVESTKGLRLQHVSTDPENVGATRVGADNHNFEPIVHLVSAHHRHRMTRADLAGRLLLHCRRGRHALSVPQSIFTSTHSYDRAEN